MTDARDRRHELVAAAATDRLDATEQRELDALAAADPTVLTEIAELREVMTRLASIEEWHLATPPAGLEERILSTTDELADRRRARVWRPALVGVAATALVVAGGLVGAAIDKSEDITAAVPVGPPGELGAVEDVTVEDVAPGVDLEAAVVAHTWGTEAIIDIDGLPVGEEFEIVLLDATGTRIEAGGFLGADGVVHCRMNAAVLREDATALQVERADGSVVGWGELPPVDG